MSPGVNPAEGKSWPDGGENLKLSPEGRVSESVIGLKESFPENAIAVTIVGEARKFMVSRFPSLRDLKFLGITLDNGHFEKNQSNRLKEVRMACG